MYIDQLELKNYRAFRDHKIDFSKITLLLGPNSGGKTSIIASLLSALQSEKFPLYFSPNGRLVETGDYRELISSHDVRRSLSVALRFGQRGGQGERPLVVAGTYTRDPDTSMPLMKSATIKGREIEWEALRGRKNYKVSWTFLPEQDQRHELRKDNPEFVSAMETMFSTLNRISRDKERSGQHEKKGRVRSVSETKDTNSGTHEGDLSSLTSPNSIQTNVWASVALTSSVNLLSEFSKRFSYIGSHRNAPQRTYYHAVGPDMKVGVCGQNTVEQILAWKNSKSSKLVDLAQVMKRLGLASGVTTNKLAGGRFEVRVTVPGSRVSSSLSDVGFGVNQLLPVVVAELQLPKGSTIAVSQPETHLHPKVQAEAASHFAEQVANRQYRYIIETHSEYLINRFRRLIRKGSLSSDDVAVYYVQPSPIGAEVHKIVFEKSGKISGAPKGFFETYQVDVLNIAMQR